MNKAIVIGIIAVVVIIGGVLASPLFYEIQVDEPLPVALDKIEPGLTLTKFSEMDDDSRQEIVAKMPEKLKVMVMDESAKTSRTISEGMEMLGNEKMLTVEKSGNFEGLAGHSASGLAKIIEIDGSAFLRFENFQVTNGPDLRVYITPDGDVKNGIHLEKLKGNKGNQNYQLKDIDLDHYGTVVIYCQPFGVYFASADLV